MSKAEIAALEAERENTPPSAEELRQQAEAEARVERLRESQRMQRESSVTESEGFSPLERRLHRQARKRGLET